MRSTIAVAALRGALAAWRDGPAVPFPRNLVYDLTLECNLHCPMCLYQGRRSRQRPFSELSRGFERFIDRIDSVYIIGAEPMTSGDLPEAVAWFKARGKRVAVQSNGTILREDVIAAVDRFDTSLDGLERANDAVRGPGSFVRTMASIDCALKHGTMGTVSTVATEGTVADIEPLVRFLEQLDVAGIDLSPVVRYTAAERDRMAALGFGPDELVMPPGTYAAGFRERFDGLLRRLGRAPLVSVSPAYLGRSSAPFFDGRPRHGQSCGAVYSLRVGPAGEVIHCGMLRRSFGGIVDEDVPALWRGAMRTFRQRLYRAGLLPICYRCCKRSWIW